MSWEKHDDDCEGCRPAIMNIETGERLPNDSPEMVAILKVWGETTLEQRQAWHRITCQNSTDQSDKELVKPFIESVQAALSELS